MTLYSSQKKYTSVNSEMQLVQSISPTLQLFFLSFNANNFRRHVKLLLQQNLTYENC